ncbi:hypothetical protein Ciccas_005176 [Cichlidogyrus casuarinus]|uniref:Uncharacterized protein n=1 Tax=Cichlidogyrus casuarinus TaxID=1844966 RepID=A0ABD2Q9E6_9PLAT
MHQPPPPPPPPPQNLYPYPPPPPPIIEQPIVRPPIKTLFPSALNTELEEPRPEPDRPSPLAQQTRKQKTLPVWLRDELERVEREKKKKEEKSETSVSVEKFDREVPIVHTQETNDNESNVGSDTEALTRRLQGFSDDEEDEQGEIKSHADFLTRWYDLPEHDRLAESNRFITRFLTNTLLEVTSEMIFELCQLALTLVAYESEDNKSQTSEEEKPSAKKKEHRVKEKKSEASPSRHKHRRHSKRSHSRDRKKHSKRGSRRSRSRSNRRNRGRS